MKPKPQRPPPSLGEPGRAVWKRLAGDFVFEDAAALEILERGCMAIDRAQEAREAVKRTGGPVIVDKNGKPQRNPGCVVERDATNTFLSRHEGFGIVRTTRSTSQRSTVRKLTTLGDVINHEATPKHPTP